ncbi:MAG: heme o synthase [Nitrosopumilaceae archaeon]|nr:heme o synthase [Nitrosopumilaceae archaeon]
MTLQRHMARSRLAVYYELTKPKIWYLLVFTAIGGLVAASNIYQIEVSAATWLLAIFSVAAGSAAANTLTNYHDRDIDGKMERTKSRPLPSGRISPPVKARNFGYALAAASLVLAWGISYTATPIQGALATAFIGFGLFNNIIVYSYLLKRRSQFNIILGGLCGGSPPLVGWVAVTTADLWTMGMVLAGLVFVWIPLHIWSLTMRYRDDYNRVDVPMLTAVRSESTSARVIAASTLAMVAFSLVPLFLTAGGAPASGMVYAVTALASGALMVAISGWVVARPTERAAWTLFKFSSPYLAVLFIGIMVDTAL